MTKTSFAAFGLLGAQLLALAGCSDSKVLYSSEDSHRNVFPGSVTYVSLTFNPDNTNFDGMELLSTPVGEFTLMPSLSAIHSKGPSLLRLVGGKDQKVELALSPSIALPAEMTVTCNRISNSDLITEDLFIVEKSSDGADWVTISRTSGSGWFKGGNGGTDGFVDLVFQVPVRTTRIRFTSNTLRNNVVPHFSGIRIREIAFATLNGP